MMLGEVPLFSTELLASYYGEGDELHLGFNFPTLYAPWDEPTWRARIDEVEQIMGPRNAWPAWALSNHDRPRHRSRYGSEAKARAAAVMLLTLRGTPFLYAGEELGLEDAVIPAERVVDPGGRDGCRAPIPWEPGPGHGWTGEDSWLPWPPEAEERNAARMRDDPKSTARLYRSLLAARRRSPALHLGSLELLPAPQGLIAYRRARATDERVVLLNFLSQVVELELPGNWAVEIASDGVGEGASFAGRLEPDQALLLRCPD
jgi:alpha-glucosidase